MCSSVSGALHRFGGVLEIVWVFKGIPEHLMDVTWDSRSVSRVFLRLRISGVRNGFQRCVKKLQGRSRGVSVNFRNVKGCRNEFHSILGVFQGFQGIPGIFKGS